MVEANVRKNMFLLKKLVKDKRFEDFEKRKWGINEKCIANSKEELIKALHAKAAEEIKELDDACAKENNIDKISSELADVQQVVQDLSSLGE